MKSQRIWELDVLRGICITAMVILHFVFDIRELYGAADFDNPAIYTFAMRWGGILFVVLSGICVTLGHHPIRRGLIVFGCGLVITAVTVGMNLLNLAGPGIIIRFGILHGLGLCMLLWPLFQGLPNPALGILGIAFTALGYWFRTMAVNVTWLFPLGLMYPGFYSADFFPLFPHLGWFLLGSLLGRTVYKEKKTLLPRVNPSPMKPLSWIGRNSLLVYMLHQPILSGLLALWLMIRG